MKFRVLHHGGKNICTQARVPTSREDYVQHATVGRMFQEVFTEAKNVEETDDLVEENENQANAISDGVNTS